MRLIAIVLNVLLICTGVWLLVEDGRPKSTEIFIYSVLFAAPLSSLVALFQTGGEGWLGLYFKRKALEERKKIEDIQNQQ